MLTTKTICAILLGAGVGSGATVAVEKTQIRKKPAIKRVVSRPVAAKPVAVRKTPVREQQPEVARIMDCPTPGLEYQNFQFAPLPPIPGGAIGWPAFGHVEGGGGFPAPSPPTYPPGAVPEPETWLMLVAGFGLIGSAARRKVVA